MGHSGLWLGAVKSMRVWRAFNADDLSISVSNCRSVMESRRHLHTGVSAQGESADNRSLALACDGITNVLESEMKIRISFPEGEIVARLDDTPTTQALMAAIPFEASASTWGEEVYFSTPVTAKPEADAREVVEPGTVCFWVQGNALALPYGPTPASHADECRLVTRVNILGMLEGDAQQLAAIKDGDAILVSAV